MDWKYRWKNGYRPSRDEAAKNPHLLDESQFENEQDRKLAEETTRKRLGVPVSTLDEDKSILPYAASPNDKV